MKVSKLIERLTYLRNVVGGDPEVLAQSQGCCRHGHEIGRVEAGTAEDEDGVDTRDEIGKIVIHV